MTVARLAALRSAAQILEVVARDPALTAAARSHALMLSGAHPSAALVDLIVENRCLCFAKWAPSMRQTHFFISALSAFAQGCPRTQSALRCLAENYPTPAEIRLLCNSQLGYAARMARMTTSGTGDAYPPT